MSFVQLHQKAVILYSLANHIGKIDIYAVKLGHGKVLACKSYLGTEMVGQNGHGYCRHWNIWEYIIP